MRAPSSPAFYVHALTTTTVAEHWPIPACAAIASSDSTCLPPTGGAQPLLTDGGAYFHCKHGEAAVPRPPTPVPDAGNATVPIKSRLVPNFYTHAPLLPAQSGHLQGPPTFAYRLPTTRPPTTDAGQLRVRTCVPLPRRTYRTTLWRHGGSPRPAQRLLPSRCPSRSTLDYQNKTHYNQSHGLRPGNAALSRHSATPPLPLPAGRADARHTATLTAAAQAFGFIYLANVPSGKWSDWVNLEVCYPTLHVYGIVAHAVSITVISDASPLQHNDIVRAGWRDQPTKQPSPTDSSS